MSDSKKKSFFVTAFLKKLGPGLITGASDDDPSGIATYSQAGAQFGISTLWTVLITFPLMFAIQEICSRIGMATSRGLTSNIKKHYSAGLVYLIILFSVPAIVLNIGADIAGMGAVAHLVFPNIPATLFSIIFIILLMIAIIFMSYHMIVAVLKYFCLSLLLYLVIPFLVKLNWLDVFKHTFIPTIHLNKEFMSILVAILGTTISPYLFFWQTTMSAEGRHQKTAKLLLNEKTLKDMRTDVGVGMLSSNLVMYFIILTTGVILFQNGITHIETVEQAAKALEPLAGKFAYLVFALGVIGTGFLAIPVLSATISYILASAFDWECGLDKKYYEAKGFYLSLVISLLLGLGINFLGISPVKALLWTAILYGLSAPVVILIIMRIANNKKIMGKYVNGFWSNTLGWMTCVLMSVAAVLLIYFLVV